MCILLMSKSLKFSVFKWVEKQLSYMLTQNFTWNSSSWVNDFWEENSSCGSKPDFIMYKVPGYITNEGVMT